jgi:CrcB protein
MPSPRPWPAAPEAAARRALGLQAAIAVGGACGALARVALDRRLPASADGLPWATLAVNLAGAFLLGYVSTRLLERLPPSTFRRPLLGTGFCGALTTFSTLQLQALRLARGGHAVTAAGYVAASLAGGLAAVYCATLLVRRARGPA